MTYTSSVNLPAPNGNNSIPAGLAIAPDGNTIYAALNGLNELAVIDVSTLQVSTQIAVGNAPWGVAPDTTHNMVWVANEGGLVPAGNDPINSSDGTNILSIRQPAPPAPISRRSIPRFRINSGGIVRPVF